MLIAQHHADETTACFTADSHWCLPEYADDHHDGKTGEDAPPKVGSPLSPFSPTSKPQFLVKAEAAGWTPYGVDACPTAVEAARAKGFDVRCGWSPQDADFANGSFAAITAIDVFYYLWHPRGALDTFHRLLRPGGVLAMRLSNKRFVLGLARALSTPGRQRDALMSRLLQSQFHSISLTALTRILEQAGFTHVTIEPHASTAPSSSLHWQTRFVYWFADALYLTSLTKVNLSPGVLLFARRNDESGS